MAEWLKASVLKTDGRKPRRFESYTIRQGPLAQRQSKGLLIPRFRVRIPGGSPNAPWWNGIHDRLKIGCRKAYWFESSRGDQILKLGAFVYWLGREPFKLAKGVRFPYALPRALRIMVNASGLHPDEWEFDSLSAHQISLPKLRYPNRKREET